MLHTTRTLLAFRPHMSHPHITYKQARPHNSHDRSGSSRPCCKQLIIHCSLPDHTYMRSYSHTKNRTTPHMHTYTYTYTTRTSDACRKHIWSYSHIIHPTRPHMHVHTYIHITRCAQIINCFQNTCTVLLTHRTSDQTTCTHTQCHKVHASSAAFRPHMWSYSHTIHQTAHACTNMQHTTHTSDACRTRMWSYSHTIQHTLDQTTRMHIHIHVCIHSTQRAHISSFQTIHEALAHVPYIKPDHA
jgi:hypothetical protein